MYDFFGRIDQNFLFDKKIAIWVLPPPKLSFCSTGENLTSLAPVKMASNLDYRATHQDACLPSLVRTKPRLQFVMGSPVSPGPIEKSLPQRSRYISCGLHTLTSRYGRITFSARQIFACLSSLPILNFMFQPIEPTEEYRSDYGSEEKTHCLKNIGKKNAGRLNEGGIFSENELRLAGAVAAHRMIKKRYPDETLPVCYYLYSFEGALADRHWNEIDEERKQELKVFFHSTYRTALCGLFAGEAHRKIATRGAEPEILLEKCGRAEQSGRRAERPWREIRGGQE
jgi:DNA transformation protein